MKKTKKEIKELTETEISAIRVLNFVGFGRRLPAYPKDTKVQKLWEHLYA